MLEWNAVVGLLHFPRTRRRLLDRRGHQPVDRLFDRAYGGAPLHLEREVEQVLSIDVWPGGAVTPTPPTS